MITSRKVNFAFLIFFSLISIFFIIINTFYCFSLVLFAFKRKEGTAIIVMSSMLTVFFMVMTILNFIYLVFNEGVNEITDIGSYHKVMRIYNYHLNKAVSHFPQNIPSYAKNISFHQIPRFLQGGDEIYLAYSAPNENFNDISKEYKNNAKYVVSSKSEIDSLGDKIYIPGRLYTTLNIKLSEKNYFSIFIIDSVPYKPNDWNHGKSYGIAINRNTRVIIYWYENW